MGVVSWFLDRIGEKRDKATFERPEAWTTTAFGGASNASGVQVSELSALRSVAVFACVRVISETIASLPLRLFVRTKDDGREVIDAGSGDMFGRLAALVARQPNPEITAFQFKEMLQAHLCLWGNAYAEIERNEAGEIIAFWPLLPDRTMPERVILRDGSSIVHYRTTTIDGQPVTLGAERVLHIAGLGFDGLVGYSPIGLAKQAVGLSLAAEEFGARFFSAGANIGGVLEHPGKLGDKAYERLKIAFENAHAGLSNAHRVKILEEGMKWTRIGIPPDEAQFLESRQFQVVEIARLFRVPPHLIADLSRSTFSNIEHQSIEFSTHTVRPWASRWENAFDVKTLDAFQARKRYWKFGLEALLRGDLKSRYDAYAVGRQWGWLSVNDVRRAEDLNPVENGDVYMQPLNMVSAGEKPAGADTTVPNEGGVPDVEA